MSLPDVSKERKPTDSTIVVGSFRKHLPFLWTAVNRFRDNSVTVLSPLVPVAINPGNEFIILSSDGIEKSPRRLQSDVMRKMRSIRFLYVANADGYLGLSTAGEMAYANLSEIPVITSQSVSEVSPLIPQEVQELLIKSIFSTVSIDHIPYLCEVLKQQSLKPQNVYTEKDKLILLSLVKRLLSSLSPKTRKDDISSNP